MQDVTFRTSAKAWLYVCILIPQILTSVPAVLHTTAVIMDSVLTLRVDSTALVMKALWAMDTSVLVRTDT
jgi:hypothetical protein